MKSKAFVTLPHTRVRQCIFLLSWVCFMFSLVCDFITIYGIVSRFEKFPWINVMFALFIHLFNLQMLGLWMPYALLLTFWEKRKASVTILYLCGCLVSIALAVACLALIDVYKDEGYLKNEWIDVTGNYIKKNGQLPFWAYFRGTTETSKHTICCGWYSPIDFGTHFSVNEKNIKDGRFMTSISHCMNDVFKVEKDPLSITNDLIQIYLLARYKDPNYPPGCAKYLKERARWLCYFLGTQALIICLIGPIFIVLYLLYIWKGPQQFPQSIQPEEEEEDVILRLKTSQPKVKDNQNLGYVDAFDDMSIQYGQFDGPSPTNTVSNATSYSTNKKMKK